MHVVRLKLILLVGVFFHNLASASGLIEVTVVEVGIERPNNYAFLKISPNQTVTNCARGDQVAWEINTEADRGMLSVALTAHSTGKKLRMYLNDSDCLGDLSRPGVMYLLEN